MTRFNEVHIGLFTSALLTPTKRAQRSHNEPHRISKMTKRKINGITYYRITQRVRIKVLTCG